MAASIGARGERAAVDRYGEARVMSEETAFLGDVHGPLQDSLPVREGELGRVTVQTVQDAADRTRASRRGLLPLLGTLGPLQRAHDDRVAGQCARDAMQHVVERADAGQLLGVEAAEPGQEGLAIQPVAPLGDGTCPEVAHHDEGT